jgi:hypothetical protein
MTAIDSRRTKRTRTHDEATVSDEDTAPVESHFIDGDEFHGAAGVVNIKVTWVGAGADPGLVTTINVPVWVFDGFCDWCRIVELEMDVSDESQYNQSFVVRDICGQSWGISIINIPNNYAITATLLEVSKELIS